MFLTYNKLNSQKILILNLEVLFSQETEMKYMVRVIKGAMGLMAKSGYGFGGFVWE